MLNVIVPLNPEFKRKRALPTYEPMAVEFHGMAGLGFRETLSNLARLTNHASGIESSDQSKRAHAIAEYEKLHPIVVDALGRQIAHELGTNKTLTESQRSGLSSYLTHITSLNSEELSTVARIIKALRENK